MAEHHNLDLSGQTVTQSFAGDTFKDTTNFSNAIFAANGGNFKGAVFEGLANFTSTVFEGKSVDFTDAVFLAGASFENAKFGNNYQRFFGEWEIRFLICEKSYFLMIRKSDGSEKEWQEIKIPTKPEGLNFSKLLKGREIWKNDNEHLRMIEAFQIFLANPQCVSFDSCRFGAMNTDGFSDEEIKQVIEKENKWIEKQTSKNRDNYLENLYAFKNHDFSSKSQLSEVEKSKLISILVRHLDQTDLKNRRIPTRNSKLSFDRASFCPQADVSFAKSLFLNGDNIDFPYVSFDNGGSVSFSYSLLANGKSVSFSNTMFSCGKDVDFSYAIFNNNKDVIFSSALFSNIGHVQFSSATFNNRKEVFLGSLLFGNNGIVDFSYVMFSNGNYVFFGSTKFGNQRDVFFIFTTFRNNGGVDFSSATFSNKGELYLSQIVWINGGGLDLSVKGYRETLPVKFDECLFLSAKGISFKEARFPENGSLMFQRCYFGRTPTVDFTGAFFRHASFEGGEISWLKDSPEQTLKDRLKDKYDCLPDKTKSQLNTGVTSVFEKGVEVLWKDLTTESAKNLTLRRVNLSHSLFDGMTLSHIQLNAPEWLEDKDGRKILYEEIKLRETALKENRAISKFDLKNIEDQYTQLKNNLEKQGNYLNAGYFHYGEQEIRRKILSLEHHSDLYSKLHNLTLRFLSWCYKWCSGYGEKPGLALGITVSIIFLCSSILAVWNSSASSFFYKWLMGFIEMVLPGFV